MPEFEQTEIKDVESAALHAEHVPEDDNPALTDTHKTFVMTLVCVAVFVGVVISFIL